MNNKSVNKYFISQISLKLKMLKMIKVIKTIQVFEDLHHTTKLSFPAQTKLSHVSKSSFY